MKIILTQEQIKRIIHENIEELNYQSFQDDQNLQVLRDAIDKNKLVGVAFVKKDGNVRHMLIRKSLSSYVGSDREKTDAQRNVDMNNDIKKVVDVNAYKKEIKRIRLENPGMNDSEVKQMASKGAWRAINLKNVLGFMVGGNFIDLRDENEIMDRYGEAVHGQLTKSMIGAMQDQAPVAEPEGDVMEQLPNQQPQTTQVKTANPSPNQSTSNPTPNPNTKVPPPVKFTPTHKGNLEVDCKNKLVKNYVINNGLQNLTNEGNGLLVKLFCEPKYRNTSTQNTQKIVTSTKPTIGATQNQAPVNDNLEPEAKVNETIYDNLKLRKLTMKSIWDFSGKHQGWTIQKVMEYAPKSLLWAYLCLEKISFVDDVLNMLKEKYKDLEFIEKPGIDKEQYEDLDNQSNPWSKYSYPELKNINAGMRANGKRVPRSLLATMDRKKSFYLKDKHDADFKYTNVDTKARMQAKNHGKIV